MKKILAILLIFAFAFALSACDNDDARGGNSKAKNDAAQSVNDDVASASVPSAGDNTTVSSGSTGEQTSAPTTQSDVQEAQITRDRAIEIALAHAGLNRSDVRDLEAELDRERGGIYWEVDFESGQYEYSYDINAQTGEIVISEIERD